MCAHMILNFSTNIKRGELGNGEAGTGCGQEAGEEGGEVLDVSPQLEGENDKISCGFGNVFVVELSIDTPWEIEPWAQ